MITYSGVFPPPIHHIRGRNCGRGGNDVAMRPPGVDRASSHSEFEASIGLPASDASPTLSLEGPAAPRASIEGGSSLVPFGRTAAGPTPSGEAATPSRKGPQAIDDVVTTIARLGE